MKRILYILLAFFFVAPTVNGQVVITDSATTQSICFNDGTITVAASGGTGSYTFSVINGPVYSNITYPITLPPNDSAFLTMPKGHYTIIAVDRAGDTAYATATVPGNYTFPVIINAADTVYSSCISVGVQGGKPPYQFSRSSIGTNAGFGPYQNSASFCHLCNGPNWIRVLDSCSNIYTTNRIVVDAAAPQFSITAQTIGQIDSIQVILTSAGTPPYTYQLNNGPIFIRNHTGIFAIPESCLQDLISVSDSCGRTFDTTINIHKIQASILSPCGSGSAVITIDPDAISPFTITGSGGPLVTHQYQISFNSLPVDSAYQFRVTDSCGNTLVLWVPPCNNQVDTNFFYPVCPFDSSIHMEHVSYPFCYPLVVSCLNCSPVQIDTIYTLPARLFTGIDTGVSYRIRIQDQCGFNETTSYIPTYAPLTLGDSIISCNVFSVYSTPRIFTPPIHYTLYDLGAFVDSITANNPVFSHLPAATYQVAATQPLCLARTITVTIPALLGSCAVPMFDSICTPSYAIIQFLPLYNQTYTLVNTSSSVSYTQLIPSPYTNAVLFYDVPAGNYNLVSDSGCSTPFVLPPFPNYNVTAVSSRQCTGQAHITASCTPTIQNCNGGQRACFTLLKDNQYIANGTSGSFTVSDTGYYVVRLYLMNSQIFGVFNPPDTLCPLDTTLVYVSNTAIPNLISPLVEVCGNINADIPYTIYGGTLPYTLEILGYPTQIVNSATGIFPNVTPGVYTMVVSDSCGISRSFSVAVIDTCSPQCSTICSFSVSDSIACVNSTMFLQNQSVGATHYRWNINGRLFAYVSDTSFITTTGGIDTITLYAYRGECIDSTKRFITVEYPLYSTGQRDTTVCIPFSIQLNSHMPNTVWSTGVSDSITIVTSPGQYLATVSNTCGSAIDTINVGTYPQIDGFNLTDDKTSLCELLPDSTMLSASIDSSVQAAMTFRWSTGLSDTGVFSSGVMVYQAGLYDVSVEGGQCPLTAFIMVDSIACDSECIGGLGFPDIFSPNGDGKNDTFFIPHICDISPFEMHIYNRWGQLVFQSSDINKGWDGKYRDSPEPQEVYWLWVSLTLPDGKVIYRTGNVTLAR